jgi:hypothetical protein
MPVANGSRNCIATNPAYASQNVEQAVFAGDLGGCGTIMLEPGGSGNPGSQPFFISYVDDLAPGTCAVYNNLLNTTPAPVTYGKADAGSSFTITGPNGALTEPLGQSQLDRTEVFWSRGHSRSAEPEGRTSARSWRR